MEFVHKYTTIEKFAKAYVDRRFNRKMTNKEIYNDLNENEIKEITNIKIWQQIKSLCEATGLVDPLTEQNK